MGANCVKGNSSSIDLRDENVKKEYYLNITKNQSDVGANNYDIIQQKKVGYAHIQKTNMFHKVSNSKCFFILINLYLIDLEPDYKIETHDDLTSAAKNHTNKLIVGSRESEIKMDDDETNLAEELKN